MGPTDREHMELVTRGARTKADKIRLLDRAGYGRSEIAAFLGTSYQHVRNVLTAPLPAGWAPPSVPARPTAAPGLAAEPDLPATWGTLTVAADGSLLLPASIVGALGARPGAVVPWRFEEGDLRLVGREARVRFAQDVVEALTGPREGRGSEALLAERRAEARRE